MITEFGKVLRIIRVNTGDSMRAMAEKIGLSPAYLSAIENGKRNIPADMLELLLKHYDLSEKDKQRVKDAIESSAVQVKIDLTELAEKKKKVIYSITKGDLDEETLDRLCEIIEKKENADK